MILQALWFFLPAGEANMAPILIKKVPIFDFLDIPIDGGKTFRGKRVFGDHKTVRGFVIGFVAALLTLLVQKYCYTNFDWARNISYVDYSTINIWLGALGFGFGALVGDAVKSFFKRQRNHPPGTAWVPFDQIDYVIGGLIGSLLIIQLQPLEYFIIFVLWFGLHPLATWVGYKLSLKKSPL